MDDKLGLWDFRIVDDDTIGHNGFFRKRFYCPACGVWQTYGATKFCPNCGHNMFPDESPKLRTYDVGFITYDRKVMDTVADETEFVLIDAPFEDMAEELLDLWEVFCDESGYKNAQITYVREVPQEAA